MISVSIATYNGASKVIHVLHALEKQSYRDFEVIVVIDGSTDHTAEVLQRTSFDLPHFRYIEQENKGRSGSRNRGARESRGELLLFFDDDTRPLPDCIEKHLAHHALHPGTIAVGGVPEDYEKVTTDFQAYKAYLSRKWVEPLQANGGLMDAEKPFLTAANCSMPKALFEQLHGFDEQLTDAEDFDLATRASRQQIPMYYLHDAIAWHDDFLTCRRYVQRQRQYQVANQMLCRLKPELYGSQSQYVLTEGGGLKKLIYSFLSNRFFVNLIDKTPVFQLFPRSIRYRFYSLVVTGLAAYFPTKKI